MSSDWHNTAEEHAIDGLKHQQGERWAVWGTEIGMLIDIKRFMANEYMLPT